MKRGVWLLIVLLSVSATIAAECLPAGDLCTPNVQSCGCDGVQTRTTDRSDPACFFCTEWSECSKVTQEFSCTDQVDNDCDQLYDCDDPDCAQNTACQASCTDNDNDGYGTGDTSACLNAQIDCNDNNANIKPGAQEVCDGVDNDCDTQVDEGCECQVGQTQTCGTNTGECVQGSQICMNGQWGQCTGSTTPKAELCIGNLDEDCDGLYDCDDPDCAGQCETQCNDIDGDGYGTGCALGPDCNENNVNINPAADEQCNDNTDNDCDNLVDCLDVTDCSLNNVCQQGSTTQDPDNTVVTPVPQCVDNDNDGYGTGFDCPKGTGDCDDNDPLINPDAEEGGFCDAIDNDCNGLIDDTVQQPCGNNVGVCQEGILNCQTGACEGAIEPATEICFNSLDDDCDGERDEECPEVFGEKERSLAKTLLKENHNNPGEALQDYRDSRNFINQKKSSRVKDGKTEITITITPIQELYNLSIYESIPKELAESADQLIFSAEPTIIEQDPLIVWHLSEVKTTTKLTYELDKEIEDAHLQTETITLAELTRPKQRSLFFTLLPLLIIPIIAFIVIHFSRYAKK